MKIGVFLCPHHGMTEYYMRSETRKGDCKKCLRERVQRQRLDGARKNYETPEQIARREIRQQAKAGFAAHGITPTLSVRIGNGLGNISSLDFKMPGGGCQWIEGDPIAEIRAGRDPHCGKVRAQGCAYCANHRAIAYVRPASAIKRAA